MRMCNVLVLALILASVSLQNEMNGNGNESSVAKGAASISPSRQQLEITSTKQLPVVNTSQVPKIDGNKDEQVSLKAAENKILASNSLKTSSLKGEKATDPPKVARTTSENAQTTIAVNTKDLRTTESVVTLEETTRQTQKTIMETSIKKRTQKEKYKKLSTAKLDESKAVTKETTEQIAPATTDLNMKTTERKRTIAVPTLSSKPTYRKTKERTFATSTTSKQTPVATVISPTIKETTKQIAPAITDSTLRTTKRKKTIAVSKLSPKPTYRTTKIKRTFATSKSTSRQTLIATVLSPTIRLRHTAKVSAEPTLTTTEEEETTDEEMIGIHNPVFQKKRFMEEQRPQQTNKSALPFILGVIAGALVVAAVLALVVLIMVLHHRKQKGRKRQSESLMLEQPPKARKMPRKMESANINATKFSHAGPLVLDAKLKGPVRHALDDNTTGAALSKVQFDPKLNEIVDIGTDVDVIDYSRMTTAATTTDTGHAIKKNNQSMKSMVPETAKIPDQLFTDKEKPKNEKPTKNAALSPNFPAGAAVNKPPKEARPKA